jgi:hypothetical protein
VPQEKVSIRSHSEAVVDSLERQTDHRSQIDYRRQTDSMLEYLRQLSGTRRMPASFAISKTRPTRRVSRVNAPY